MSDCVISNYCKTIDGYARISVDGAMQYHHRIAYIQHHGLSLEDIKDKVVMHSCDNPPCINPAHLKLGTQADNMSDMTVKGRHAVDYSTTNKIGLKGVCNAGRGKFGAQIFVSGRSFWLGTFDNPEEAHAAYMIALEKKKQSIEARQRKSTGTCVGKPVE